MRAYGFVSLIAGVVIFLGALAMPGGITATIGGIFLGLFIAPILIIVGVILLLPVGNGKPLPGSANWAHKKRTEYLIKNDPEYRRALREALKDEDKG